MNFYFLEVYTRSLNMVRERGKNTKFEFFLDVITGHIQKCAPSQLFLVNLERF